MSAGTGRGIVAITRDRRFKMFEKVSRHMVKLG